MKHSVLSLLFFLIVFNVNDVVMTHFFISYFDGTESNVLVSAVIKSFGFGGVVILKMLPLLLLFTIYAILMRQKRTFPKRMIAPLVLAVALYGVLAFYHLTETLRLFFGL